MYTIEILILDKMVAKDNAYGTVTVQFHIFWKLPAFFSCDNDDSSNNHIL